MVKRQWPKGRIGADDEGATDAGIAADLHNKLVIVRFPQPTEWLGFDPESAIGFLQSFVRALSKIAGTPITIRFESPTTEAMGGAIAAMEWRQDGEIHYLLLPSQLSQIGVRGLHLTCAASGWVAVIEGRSHRRSAAELTDETCIELLTRDLEQAKSAAIAELRKLIQSAVEALPESSGGAR
jgi:hypothetical protein